jgi:hypothetical protein
VNFKTLLTLFWKLVHVTEYKSYLSRLIDPDHKLKSDKLHCQKQTINPLQIQKQKTPFLTPSGLLF